MVVYSTLHAESYCEFMETCVLERSLTLLKQPSTAAGDIADDLVGRVRIERTLMGQNYSSIAEYCKWFKVRN